MRRSFFGRAGLPLCALVGLIGCCSRDSPPPTLAGFSSDAAAAHGAARQDARGRWAAVRGLEDGSLSPLDRTPLEQLVLVLDGYTRAKRDVTRAPEGRRHSRALFYCAQLNAEFSQCLLFDGADAGAHVTGIEYVISGDLYATLPQSERQYWHSHSGEVDSGVMVAPGLPDEAHTELMGELRTTYGKGWRVWDSEHDSLPLGEPTLMWSIAPGKLEPEVRSEMRSRRSR